MKKYLFIMVGGMLGAMLRYLIKTMPAGQQPGSFPLRTLLINLAGTLILTVFLTLTLELLTMKPEVRLGVATGFLGAFTTFSTLCKETINLYEQGHWVVAAGYIVLSVVLGLIAAYLGHLLAKNVLMPRLERPES